MSETTLLWFRLDLRLADNPALAAALSREAPVVPVFIWSPEEEGAWQPGNASRWWLHQSLRELAASLRRRGSRLILRQGPALPALRELREETRATAVYWNRRYEPASIERDRWVMTTLREEGCIAESFNSSLLLEPWHVSTQEGRPYQVFSAFWKGCLAPQAPEPLSPAPSRIRAPRRWPATLPLQGLKLQPALDRVRGWRADWHPGEAGAQQALATFLERGLSEYSAQRDRPDVPGTSRLSPYLHFGEIGPRQVWAAVRGGSNGASEAAECFLRELGWREFAYHLLFHFPDTPTEPLRQDFGAFPWKHHPGHLRAWQRGQTGYPIVDAGMHQLWQTGWMHNRVRMIVASFLVKDLLIPWQQGAAWFWDTLLDADLANNTLGWQWTAGCGVGAAPYFRIFHPVRQGERFDPAGDYVRRWVPELGKLPNQWIHQPWEAPVRVLADAGVELGATYPRPLIDHHTARQRALAAFQQLRRPAIRSWSGEKGFS